MNRPYKMPKSLLVYSHSNYMWGKGVIHGGRVAGEGVWRQWEDVTTGMGYYIANFLGKGFPVTRRFSQRVIGYLAVGVSIAGKLSLFGGRGISKLLSNLSGNEKGIGPFPIMMLCVEAYRVGKDPSVYKRRVRPRPLANAEMTTPRKGNGMNASRTTISVRRVDLTSARGRTATIVHAKIQINTARLMISPTVGKKLSTLNMPGARAKPVVRNSCPQYALAWG